MFKFLSHYYNTFLAITQQEVTGKQTSATIVIAFMLNKQIRNRCQLKHRKEVTYGDMRRTWPLTEDLISINVIKINLFSFLSPVKFAVRRFLLFRATFPKSRETNNKSSCTPATNVIAKGVVLVNRVL